ncbi:hypothetical protein J6590_067404 [Homalodisca vitripennis]|nr:hypothetical protein J6590_067404 [Homalodisca vitripennis]
MTVRESVRGLIAAHIYAQAVESIAEKFKEDSQEAWCDSCNSPHLCPSCVTLFK